MASPCIVLEDHVRSSTREKLTYTCRVLQLLKEDTDPTEEPSSWKARALMLHSSEHKCTEARGQQCEQALATAREHIMFHSKTQRLTSCVPLSTLRGLLQPSASWILLVEPEDTRVSGSIYKSTPTLQWDLLFKTLSISWELDTSCHRTLSTSLKCSCRELPTQTTLEKNWGKLCDLRIRVVLQTSGSNLTTPRAVHCFQVDQ